MIEIEVFTNIFLLLNKTDKTIIERYIQGYSIKTIAQELHLSQSFVFKRIYQFRLKLEKNIHSKAQ